MTVATPQVELRHLRYFLAVFEELHFGRAAERLFMAQPPLSQAIRKLEAELGVKLFDRTSRFVTPTPAGYAFAEEARKVLAGLEVAVADARRASAGAEAALRIGCVPHLPFTVVQRFVGALRREQPAIDVDVTHLLSLELIGRVRDGALDLAIVHRGEDYEGMEMEEIAAGEPLAGLLPFNHRAAAKDVVGPDDLGDDVLVTGARSRNPALYDLVVASIADAGYRFRGIREAGGGADVRDLVLALASGDGVALIPSSIDLDGTDGTIVLRRALDPILRMPNTVVAWRRDPPDRVRPLLDTIRGIAREMHQPSSSVKRSASSGPRVART